MSEPDRTFLPLDARRTRRAGLAWAVLVGGMITWTVLRILGGGAVNGDLMALLPAATRGPGAAAAVQKVQSRAERQLLLLVGGGQAGAAADAARHVRALLKETGLVSSADAILPGADAIGLAGRHRWALLTEEARAQLSSGDLSGFERTVLRRYFGPGAALSSELVERDPLLLLPAFLEAQAADLNQRITMVDGLPALRDGAATWVLVRLELTTSPFSFAVQDRLMPIIDALKVELAARTTPVRLLAAGVLPHAAAGKAGAKAEISLIGTISLLGVALLLVGVFRSARPLLLCATAITVGCFASLAVTLALFGQIYLFTLVFGISLTGTAVDYAVHFFATQFRESPFPWQPQAALGQVLPGITLGLLTTAIGFGALLLSGFPGLVQIACFSIVGLAAAWLTTVLWLPSLSRPRSPIPAGAVTRLADGCLAVLSRPGAQSIALVLLACLLGLATWGALRATPLDDVRAFQSRDESVAIEQVRVEAIVGQSLATAFFLVQGRDAAELLVREEALGAVLARGIGSAGLEGYVALSRFVPSPVRQRTDLALLRSAVEMGSLDRIAARIGLVDRVVARARADLATTAPLTLPDWLGRPASAPFRHLWLGPIEGTDTVASIVLLRGSPDPAALTALPLPEGVQLLDPVSDISGVFAAVRGRAAWLILGSYLVVATVLMLRYGPAGGIRVFAVPLAAGCVCVAFFGLSGGVSLFHQMALLLVLGMGVDYGLFFREAGQAERRSTLIAVAMSALTTVLAFGLLAFSDTMAISAFGQTVAIGIVTAFLVSPFLKRSERPAQYVMESTDVG